jgi:hypothetical protein
MSGHPPPTDYAHHQQIQDENRLKELANWQQEQQRRAEAEAQRHRDAEIRRRADQTNQR